MRSCFFASAAVLAFFASGCGGDSGATPSDQDTGTSTDSFVLDSGGHDGIADSATDSASDSSTDSVSIDSSDGAPTDGVADTTDTAPPGESGKSCTATGGECGSTDYCDAPGCGSGTCKPRPGAPSVNFAATCGCDGVTYWNAEQAAALGVSVSGASTGECSGPSSKTCGGLIGKPCGSGQTCVYDLSSFSTCGVADVGGQCWSIPSAASCPGGAASYRDCTTSTCTTYCDAVKSGHDFRSDSSC